MVQGRGKWKIGAAILGCVAAGGLFWAADRRMPREISICELQGLGQVSDFQDREVLIRGLVIFTIPDEGQMALLDDRCPETGEGSRGVMISLLNDFFPVQLGDEIRVRGTVREVDGETRVEAGSQGLEILSLGNPLPEPAEPSTILQKALSATLEDWEGQLVFFPRAIIREASGAPGTAAVVPDFVPDPSLGMICFHGDQIEVLLNGADSALLRMSEGTAVENLVGLVRENQDGYYLQQAQEPLLSIPFSQQQTVGHYPGQQLLGTGTSEVLPTPFLSGTPSVSATATCTSSPTPIPSPTFYPLPLLISEFLPNPVGDEPGGEWIEIYNPGGKKLPLDGIKLGDERSPSGKEGMLRFPDGYRIGGGEVLVIANQAREFTESYGFRPDFEISDSDPQVPDLLPYPEWGRSAIQLSNSADEVLLISPWDQILDLAAYGAAGSGTYNQLIEAPKEGHSLERYPPDQDRDLPSDWRESYPPSPGTLSRIPSGPTPSASSPATATPQASLSFTPTATEIPTHTETVPALPTASPTPSQLATGTVTDTMAPLPSLTTTPGLTSTATLLPLATPTLPDPPQTLTPVSTPGTATQTPAAAASLTASPSPLPTASHTATPTAVALTPSPLPSSSPAVTAITPSAASDTPLASAVSTMTLTVTGTDLPTEEPLFTPTATASPLPALQINEIHADPDPAAGDSNADGVVNADDDEFLELVNLSGSDLDLGGWEIHDGVRLRYAFPPGTVLKAGCGLVVFGGGSPAGDFGGSLVFTAGSLGLNNTGDSLTVKDQEGKAITSCSYGEEGGQDQSLTRFPDVVGDLPLVLHALVPAAEGSLFSPGVRVDGMPFGDCP